MKCDRSSYFARVCAMTMIFSFVLHGIIWHHHPVDDTDSLDICTVDHTHSHPCDAGDCKHSDHEHDASDFGLSNLLGLFNAHDGHAHSQDHKFCDDNHNWTKAFYQPKVMISVLASLFLSNWIPLEEEVSLGAFPSEYLVEYQAPFLSVTSIRGPTCA